MATRKNTVSAAANEFEARGDVALHADSNSAALFNLLDAVDSETSHALTLSHILFDIVLDDECVSDDDVNDPASKTQRMFAIVGALRTRLQVLESAATVARSEVSHG